MAKTITIDPVTRIEGHLKITVEVDNGMVVDAHSVGTMFRGIEKLLEGKDPRDAAFVTSRVCGVCFSVHTMASSLCLEDAFGATVPAGGRLLRNLMMGAQYLYDHILHFYHLSALDYVQVERIQDYTGSDPGLVEVREKVARLIEAGDAHPLVPTYASDEHCVGDPETVATLVSHYLKALEMQMLAKRMGAIFGGRAPHYRSIVVGGVTKLPTSQEIKQFRQLLEQVSAFVRDVYVADVTALATGPWMPLAASGLGAGHPNFLAYGAFDETEAGEPLFAPGVITELDPQGISVDALDPEQITESVKHAWYEASEPLHPSVGETRASPDAADGYSFCKAPRYAGKPYEVGPLARMLIRQEPRLMTLLEQGAQPGVVARHAARAFETTILCDAMARWVDELESAVGSSSLRIHDTERWEPPESGQGAGFYDAPRGALGHWIDIRDRRIGRYQMVVPTTWNASPRDEAGARGPYEEALIGCPVPDEDNPINVVRVVRSFDPCLGCAVHVIDRERESMRKYVVDPVLGIWC